VITVSNVEVELNENYFGGVLNGKKVEGKSLALLG
jgi:hypothetical protein